MTDAPDAGLPPQSGPSRADYARLVVVLVVLVGLVMLLMAATQVAAPSCGGG
jgi:hypothetical protein